MKPLILEYKEQASLENLDHSLIEYDETLNLSINKSTRTPAIEQANLETETFTKANCEVSDTDKDMVSILMSTTTLTRSTETSDTDFK